MSRPDRDDIPYKGVRKECEIVNSKARLCVCPENSPILSAQGRHCPWEDGRRKRKVGCQRLRALNHGGHAGRIRDVCLMVARACRHCLLCCRWKLLRVPIELGSRPVLERLVGPLVPADPDELKVVAQFASRAQSGESGQQVARGEVASAPSMASFRIISSTRPRSGQRDAAGDHTDVAEGLGEIAGEIAR